MKNEIEEYLKYCKTVRGMTEATLKQKRSVLERFARMSGVEAAAEIDDAAFSAWMEGLRGRGVSANSINIYNSVIAAFVRSLRDAGMNVPLRLAMMRKLKESRSVRKYYTREEVEKVIGMADDVTGLMIRVMFETGMRIAELAWLRVGDFEGRKITFVGKGRKTREVYVSEKTRGLVEEYVRHYGVEDYLWCVDAGMMTNDKNPLTPNTIRVHMRRAFAEAGFEGFYPHALRHSFATDLQRRGASVEEIKEMIGHENIATTERYMHGFDGRMKELFDKYR